MLPIRFSVSIIAAAAAICAAPALRGDEPPDDSAEEAVLEAIPPAEKEKMDAECAYIEALVEANMPDFATRVISQAREKWPVLSAKLDVLEQKGELRLGHFDKVKEAIGKKKKGSPEYWALSIALANAYYARQMMPECRKIYGDFFRAVPKPTKELMDFYEEAAYTWIQILCSEKKFGDAISIYDSLLKLPLSDLHWSTFAVEEAELCLKLAAEEKDPKKREAYINKAAKRADRMLWMSHLIVKFGQAVALKAHTEMARGNLDRAQALVNEYMPQLQDIHKQLVEMDPDGSQGLVRESPMPSCRFLLAEMLWSEAMKEKAAQKPDEEKIKSLIFGARQGGKRNGLGAFNHAINVFMKYPESSWAASAGELSETIRKFVKDRYKTEIKTNITAAQMENVRKMQFKAANDAFREARWADAKKAFLDVLSRNPESENSQRAVAKLAGCAFELWKAERDSREKAALRCECDAIEGYFAERFSGFGPERSRIAGDDVLRIAGRENASGSRAQGQRLYDMYFRLYPSHYQAAQMAMSLGAAAYKAEDYATAALFFGRVAERYTNSTYRAQALQMMGACCGRQGDTEGQIGYLKRYLEISKTATERVSSRLSLALLERNRGLVLYEEASTNAAAAELEKSAAMSVLSAVKNFRTAASEAKAAIASPLLSPDDKKKVAASLESALFLEGDTWQRLQKPIGKMDIPVFLGNAAKAYGSYLEANPKGKFAPQALVMLGTVYTALGDTAKSKDAFSRLAKEYPDSDEAKNSVPRYAKALMDMGRKADAVGQYELMLKTAGNYTPAQFIAAGDALVDFKAYDTAQMLYSKAAELAKGKPNEAVISAKAQIGEAKALLGSERRAEAHEALDKFIEKNSRSAVVVDAYMMLMKVASEEGRREMDNNLRRKYFNAAIAALKKVRQFRPEMEDELALESSDILVRKMEAEEAMQLKAEAEETMRLAVAGFQAFLVAHEPNEEHPVEKMSPKQLKNLERCYATALPLMARLGKDFAGNVVKYGETYLDIFPNGKARQTVQNAINGAKAEL